MEKNCGKCSHSMVHPTAEQVFCIAHPPAPIVFNGGIITVFPSMMNYGKCDEFIAGKTQPLSVPAPIKARKK